MESPHARYGQDMRASAIRKACADRRWVRPEKWKNASGKQKSDKIRLWPGKKTNLPKPNLVRACGWSSKRKANRCCPRKQRLNSNG